jgi:hypothetical protein
MAHIFKFGIHRGKEITDSRIDNSYLEFLIAKNKQDIRIYQTELDRRAALENASDDMATRLIQAGYRTLAKQLHPDVGGDPEKFQELLGSKEILMQVLEKLK